MCARFTLRKKHLKAVADALDAEYSPDDEPLYRPRFNVAPTDIAWIVEFGGDRRVLRPATWNYLVSGGRPLINLRGENVGSGAGYRDAFASRRCAAVTDGFYEWPTTKGNAPTFYHRPDDGLVLLAGLLIARRALTRTRSNSTQEYIGIATPVPLSVLSRSSCQRTPAQISVRPARSIYNQPH